MHGGREGGRGSSLEMDELQSLRNPLRGKWHARSHSCDNGENPPATAVLGAPTATFREISSLLPLFQPSKRVEGIVPVCTLSVY